MAVECFFSVRLEDVQVDVGFVRVPRHHDAQVAVEDAREAGVGRLRRFFAPPRLGEAPVGEGVALFEGDERKGDRVALPRGADHFVEAPQRFFGVFAAAAGAGPLLQREREVAPRLRVFGAEARHAAQGDDRRVERVGFEKPPRQHAQQRRVFDAQFREVREDAHREGAVAFFEEPAGAVEVEGGGAAPFFLLEKVGLAGSARIGRFREFLQVGRVRRPRFDFD